MCVQVARGETAGPDELVVPVDLVVRRSCGAAS
jgi:hypothetical protein